MCDCNRSISDIGITEDQEEQLKYRSELLNSTIEDYVLEVLGAHLEGREFEARRVKEKGE